MKDFVTYLFMRAALLYVTSPFSQFIESSGAAPGSVEELMKRADRAIEIAKKYDKHEWRLEDLKGNLSTYLSY